MKSKYAFPIKAKFVILPRICKKCFFKFWFTDMFHFKIYGIWKGKSHSDAYREYIDYYLCPNCIIQEAQQYNQTINEYINEEAKKMRDLFKDDLD